MSDPTRNPAVNILVSDRAFRSVLAYQHQSLFAKLAGPLGRLFEPRSDASPPPQTKPQTYAPAPEFYVPRGYLPHVASPLASWSDFSESFRRSTTCYRMLIDQLGERVYAGALRAELDDLGDMVKTLDKMISTYRSKNSGGGNGTNGGGGSGGSGNGSDGSGHGGDDGTMFTSAAENENKGFFDKIFEVIGVIVEGMVTVGKKLFEASKQPAADAWRSFWSAAGSEAARQGVRIVAVLVLGLDPGIF